MTGKKRERLFLSIMVLAMIMWGASWISAKSISHLARPDVIAFWRLLLAFISFIPIVLFQKGNLVLKASSWLQVGAAGILLAVYNQLFFMGLENGLPGKGGVLVTTLNPLFTFLITLTLLRQATSRIQLWGLALGLTGGVLLLEIWHINLDDLIATGNLYFIVSAAVWAVLTVVSQYSQRDLSDSVFSFYVYGIASVCSFAFSVRHAPFDALTCGLFFWINMAFLSVCVISFATTAYFMASKHIGANRTSSFTFLVPFTAVSLSWLVFGETPSVITLAGGSLALVAIYMISTSTPFRDKDG